MIKGETYAGFGGKNGERDQLGDTGINGKKMSR
jgi:hypothetical protein